MNHESKNPELTNLPVVPLRGTVAFPHTIFRMEFRSEDSAFPAVNIALGDDADRRVLLLTQKDILEDEPLNDDFYDVGVVAKIEKAIQGTEGNRTVIFTCLSRAHVMELSWEDTYFDALALAQEEPDAPVTDESKEDLYRLARMISDENDARGNDMLRNSYLAVVSCEDVGKTADCISSALLNDYRHRQKMLDIFDPYARLGCLITFLKEEFAWAACEAKIESDVHAGIEESHKEYYLREKMKAIQAELGEEDDDEIVEYQKKMDSIALPDPVREKLEKELSRLSKTPYGAAESTVLRNYLDTCLDIPFGKFASILCSSRKRRRY